tara:strand:- start:347 stop:1099 length:753 start_codon:yes stop_codon:yes gene_type:complete
MPETKKDISRMVKPFIKAPRNGKIFNKTIMDLDNIYRNLKTNKGKSHLENAVLKYYTKYGSRHSNREPLNLDDLEGGCLCKYSKFTKLEGGFLSFSDIKYGIDKAKKLYNSVLQYARDEPWTYNLAKKIYESAMSSDGNIKESAEIIKRFYVRMKKLKEDNQWSIDLANKILNDITDKKNTETKYIRNKPTRNNIKDVDTQLSDSDDDDFDLDDMEINDLMRKLRNVDIKPNTEAPSFKGRKKIRTKKRF